VGDFSLSETLEFLQRFHKRTDETLRAGGCHCDPPGSGEEYCLGHCDLRMKLKTAREDIQRLRGALLACCPWEQVKDVLACSVAAELSDTE
jgi:hypothetical protein